MVINVATNYSRLKARRGQAHVYLDGVEVTNDCFYCDTRRGVVRLFVPQLENGQIAKRELRGRVKVTWEGIDNKSY